MQFCFQKLHVKYAEKQLMQVLWLANLQCTIILTILGLLKPTSPDFISDDFLRFDHMV